MNTAVLAEAKLAPDSNDDVRVHKILRVNPTTTNGFFRPKPLQAYHPDEFRQNAYHTGDGEFQTYAHRPGCLDFKKYPSHGNQT